MAARLKLSAATFDEITKALRESGYSGVHFEHNSLTTLRTQHDGRDLSLVRMEEDTPPDEMRMARAVRDRDCRHITTLDSLREAIADIQALPPNRGSRLCMMWLDYELSEPEGSHKFHTRYANVTSTQSIAYFDLARQDCLDWFMGKTDSTTR